MNYNELKNKLRAKKYDEIPAKELNALALKKDKGDLELIVNSLQRLAIKAITSVLKGREMQDGDLMQLYSATQEGIAVAINKYKEDKIDFALFSYHHIMYKLYYYLNYEMGIVKTCKINNEKIYATSVFLESFQEFDIENEEEEKNEIKINLDFIKKELFKGKHPIKKENWEIFCEYQGFDIGKKRPVKQIAKKYGMTPQNISILSIRIKKKIKENEKICKYLSNLDDFSFL